MQWKTQPHQELCTSLLLLFQYKERKLARISLYNLCGLQKDTTHAKIQRHCSCFTYIHKLHVGFRTSGLIKDLDGHRNLYCFSLRDPDPLEKEKRRLRRQ